MKNTLLLLFLSLFISTSTMGQEVFKITCNTEADCRIIADSLLKDGTRRYIFGEGRQLKSEPTYELRYEGQPDSDELRVITVAFKRYKEGENLALEIEGTTVYALYDIKGRFLDIFPIWASRIDLDASAEAISIERAGVKIEVRTDEHHTIYEFKPLTGDRSVWTIRIREYGIREPIKYIKEPRN